MESLQEIEKAQLKEDDAPEVSYTVLVCLEIYSIQCKISPFAVKVVASSNGTSILGISNGVALGVNGISNHDIGVFEYSPTLVIAPFLDKD
jgi:hypothetical protein